MTQQEYDNAVSGLASKPQKIHTIDRQRHISRKQLDAAAAKDGLKLAVASTAKPPIKAQPLRAVAPAAGKKATPVRTPPTPVRTPPTPVAATAPVVPPVQAVTSVPDGAGATDEGGDDTSESGSEAKSTVSADGVEIPENLGTLGYNQLRSLAAKLGISPVPNGTAALVVAIDAKRV